MKKILLIDDEEDFCYFLKINMELYGGYKIIISSDLKKVVKTARRHKPDIILLDIMMPDISGFEILKQLKNDKKISSIPVILLTARDDEESKNKGMELGAEEYIIKPFEIENLKDKIEKIINR
ncbi:MAG: response regulator transcription factor [Candidatus Aminicenantaceae bacterium]